MFRRPEDQRLDTNGPPNLAPEPYLAYAFWGLRHPVNPAIIEQDKVDEAGGHIPFRSESRAALPVPADRQLSPCRTEPRPISGAAQSLRLRLISSPLHAEPLLIMSFDMRAQAPLS